MLAQDMSPENRATGPVCDGPGWPQSMETGRSDELRIVCRRLDSLVSSC